MSGKTKSILVDNTYGRQKIGGENGKTKVRFLQIFEIFKIFSLKQLHLRKKRLKIMSLSFKIVLAVREIKDLLHTLLRILLL